MRPDTGRDNCAQSFHWFLNERSCRCERHSQHVIIVIGLRPVMLKTLNGLYRTNHTSREIFTKISLVALYILSSTQLIASIFLLNPDICIYFLILLDVANKKI